jgi:hypothetical protein
MKKESHKVVVVGAGLAGSLVAKEFAEEFAGKNDSIMVVDAAPEPGVDEIGSPNAPFQAGAGNWQRHATVTSFPDMARESREIYEALGKEYDLPTYTAGDSVTVQSTHLSGFEFKEMKQKQALGQEKLTELEKMVIQAEELDVPYAFDGVEEVGLANSDSAPAVKDVMHPVLSEFGCKAFIESEQTAGIIHNNSVFEACKRKVLESNDSNQYRYNTEITRQNTKFNESTGKWEITLDDETLIEADHVVFCPGAKGVMDLIEEKETAFPFIKPEEANKYFSPQRAPAFMYRFHTKHNIPNMSFLNRDNTIISDVIFNHPDGKHVYFARYSDPANPFDQIEQLFGSDSVTELDREIVRQRIQTLNKDIQFDIEVGGWAELVQETVYRYMTTTSGMPVSQDFHQKNYSILLGGQGGWAKTMPSLAKEHVRQVLGRELDYPEITNQCTLANCEKARREIDEKEQAIILSESKDGRPRRIKKGTQDPIKKAIDSLANINNFDMYEYDRVLTRLLTIARREEKGAVADETLLQRFYELINQVPHLKEFVGNCHINGSIEYPELFGKDNHILFIKDELLHYMEHGKAANAEDNSVWSEEGRTYFENLKKKIKKSLKDSLLGKNPYGPPVEDDLYELKEYLESCIDDLEACQLTVPFEPTFTPVIQEDLSEWDNMFRLEQAEVLNQCASAITMQCLSQALGELLLGQYQEKPGAAQVRKR